MCKIDDFIDVTSRYIAELLDLRADIRPVEKDVLHTFPANITAGYTFCTANLLGHDVVLLYSADSSAYTPGQMRKQKELVERKAQCPVIFVLCTASCQTSCKFHHTAKANVHTGFVDRFETA